MNNYIYSAALNMICATVLKKDYELAGTWPDDAVTLSEQHAVEFMAAAPQGKMMAAGIDGLPAWIGLPPPTDARLLEQGSRAKPAFLIRRRT